MNGRALVRVARLTVGGVAARKLARVLSRVPGLEGSMKTKNKPGDTLTGKAKGIMNGARVKDAGDRLSRKRYAVTRGGNALAWGAKAVERPSEYDTALIGVYAKFALKRLGMPAELTEWERALLSESAEKAHWVGTTPTGDYYGGGTPDAYAPAARVKQLLDDTVSGGLYLAPVVLDEAVITYPLLSGELFPYVDVVPVTGRRVSLPTVQNMTVTWGTAAGTAATPMTTAGLVANLDTVVQPVSGFIEVSNDLLADSPVAIGQTLVGLFGERMKAELDRVVAVGNGNTEPLGLTNATGVVAVNSDNGAVGPPTVSDAEALVFAVPKQYRAKDWNPSFVMNDVSYRRFRSMQVGSDDQRRVFGMDEQTYTLLEYPARIVNDLPNTLVLFGCLKKVRVYQRLGMEVVRESGGRQLTLANTTLIGVRARFGGRPVDGNAFSKMQDFQE